MFFFRIFIIVSAVTLTISHSCLAQNPSFLSELSAKKGNGKIKSVVKDYSTDLPVEFATVSIHLQGSNDVVSGSITDLEGNFEISGLAEDTYRLEIGFLGYETILLNDIKVIDGEITEIAAIKLQVASQLLNEITVTAQKSMIEEKVDRMVYNAGQDILSRGGDATDVLRKVPLLQVDLDGNVSIRGSGNIRVLINNKPSTIIASSIADALKMIPSDIIDKVEVITSPSAKYDAEGSGGIINIITKKNNIEGQYLNVNTGLGLRGSNLGVNGSFRRGKFGLTLGGNGRAFYNKAETDLMQLTTLGGISKLTEQMSDASDNGLFGRYSLGFDYDLDPTQFISGGIRYGLRNFNRDELQTTQLFTNDVIDDSRLSDITSSRNSGTIDINLDYLKVFKPQQELSFSTLYSTTNENSNFVSENLDAQENYLSSFKNLDDNMNREFTIQSDFITPLGENQILELGAKGIFRMVNSDFSYLTAKSQNNFVFDPSRPAGTLDYDQQVAAAYTSYTLKLPNDFTLKAGVRWEKTVVDAKQDDLAIDISDYNNFVPSINASKKLSEASTLKLGYNRRIQRPWLRQLNPNINIQNSQDVQIGNPNLRPELTDNLELGLSTMIAKTFLNISIYGRSTDNAINQVRYPLNEENGAIVTTYDNIGKEKSLGLDFFANVNISDKFSINGGLNARYAQLNGQVASQDGLSEEAVNSGYNFGGRIMSQLKLDKGWNIQAFSFMQGRRIELQGSKGGFGMYAIGFNKEFNDKKGSIGLAVENFASRGWNMSSQLDAALFTQTSNMYLLNRSVRLNFSYKFGAMDAKKATKKTKAVNNTDLMEGAANNNANS